MISKSVQTEVDASYLYQRLAETESDPVIAEIFHKMSQIEKGHAIAFLKSQHLSITPFPKPSIRAKILDKIGAIFGYDYILHILMDTEKSISTAIISEKMKRKMELSGGETNHVKILQSILDSERKIKGTSFTRFEKKHRSVGGNAIRAAVLGGNDGLVSNFSLVMGVAGATHGESGILISGLAGLLAGALSMSLGEWISVKSSQEVYENQMEIEMEELEQDPEGERQELALIYMAKGIPSDQAHEMSHEIIQDKTKAHEVLIKEELGINTEDLKGSPMEAALFSFFMFAFGAIIPVLPFFFFTGMKAVLSSIILSTIGLFTIGAAITLFTGKSFWYSGFRQVLFGLIAAAITYTIGNLIGVTIAG
jgi:VIT1/CCC1 family predicted Fe2+/Mn2+ transporter